MRKIIVIGAILILFSSCNKRKDYWCVCTDENDVEWRRTLVSGETYDEAWLQCVPSGNSDACVLH